MILDGQMVLRPDLPAERVLLIYLYFVPISITNYNILCIFYFILSPLFCAKKQKQVSVQVRHADECPSPPPVRREYRGDVTAG
jgi:hypothetical protein